MSATDELREGLRKRGESWHKWPDDGSTTWQAYSNPHTATESMDGTLIVTGLTPAQAIAATLGDGEYERKMDELLCRLTSGRWSKTREYDLDFMESMVREEFETEQAIAATLGDADATPTRQGVDPMTLAEAIAHEEWAATTAHGELAAEHAQMRDWLRELERMRSARDVWQENDAKLRERVSELEELTDGERYIPQEWYALLQAENAKLRELARGLGQCAQGVDCEDCLLYDRSEPDHCREERLSRELGIEVDDV